MIKTTRWRPDTCPCILEYTWDTDDPPDKREHTISAIIEACPFHQATKDDLPEHFKAVLGENQRKNSVVSLVAGVAGLEASEIPWSITEDADRKLTVEIRAGKLDPVVLQTLKDDLAVEHGAGKVDVVEKV